MSYSIEYIIVDRLSGALVAEGYNRMEVVAPTVRDGQLLIQFPAASIDVIEVQAAHPGLARIRVPNLDVLKPRLTQLVDAEAGGVLAPFYTAIDGQDDRYSEKRAEALSWQAGDDAENPARYPFMVAEAEERGVSVAAVRASILARLAQRPTVAKIEAKRVATKDRVRAATNSFDAVTATNIDWGALLPA